MAGKLQPKTRSASRTKAAILLSAGELFAKKGYVGASMSDLAESLDISKAAIYHHFENKESILRTLVNSLSDDFEKLLMEAETSPAKSFDRGKLLRGFAEILNAHQEIMGLSLTCMCGVPSELISRADNQIVRLQKLLAGKRPSQETVLRARCAIGVITTAFIPLPSLPGHSRKTIELDLLMKVANSTLGI